MRSRHGPIGLLLMAACGQDVTPPREPPPVVVWAWQRPEDLGFLAGTGTGVAVWIGSVWLAGDEARVEPRRDPVAVPSATYLLAAVRLEVDPSNVPALSERQVALTADAIEALWVPWRVTELQLDFDARSSQRAFYRKLLVELRRRLGAGIRLSITALASWCFEDAWLEALPVDEVVPMLFRMGPEGPNLRARVEGRGFPSRACRSAVGLSSDEPLVRPMPVARLYLFHPKAWTPRAYEEFCDRLDHGAG